MDEYANQNQAREFRNAWERYLRNLQKIVERKLATRRRSRRDSLSPLVKKTFELLLEEQALSEVELAATKVNARVLKLFKLELEIFISGVEDDEYDVEEAMDDGEVAKGSAEKILDKLPKRLKGILKVLNEILKMLRGG